MMAVWHFRFMFSISVAQQVASIAQIFAFNYSAHTHTHIITDEAKVSQELAKAVGGRSETTAKVEHQKASLACILQFPERHFIQNALTISVGQVKGKLKNIY